MRTVFCSIEEQKSLYILDYLKRRRFKNFFFFYFRHLSCIVIFYNECNNNILESLQEEIFFSKLGRRRVTHWLHPVSIKGSAHSSSIVSPPPSSHCSLLSWSSKIVIGRTSENGSDRKSCGLRNRRDPIVVEVW